MSINPNAHKGFARAAQVVLAYTVAVVLWGAYVRATGSGAGCGRHWPRCNGQTIPRSPSAETIIEFTHRATSGLALLAVVALLVYGFRRLPKGAPARAGAVASVVLMLTEAAVGAGLVLLELVGANSSGWRAFMMALHLVNTFFLLGAITLTAWWATGAPRIRLRGQGPVAVLMLSAIVLTLIVGVTGAITALGDTLFPKTSVGLNLSPTAHFLERLRVVHPAIAIATGLFVVLSGAAVRRMRPDASTVRFSRMLAWLFGLQIVAGTVNVVLLVPVWMQIVHLLLADALWIALVLTAASALADGRVDAKSAATTVARLPEPAGI